MDIAQENKIYTLVFEMVSGRYDQDMRYWNSAWSGECRFRLTDSFEGIREQDIITEGLFGELSFNQPFELHKADYNADGQPDFVLTQFGASSAGDLAVIVTLNRDGTVSLLRVGGDPRVYSPFGLVYTENGPGEFVFLLPYQHFDGSTALEQIENGFAVEYGFSDRGDELTVLFEEEQWDLLQKYSPNTICDIYLWQKDRFVFSRQELRLPDGSILRSDQM